MTGKIQTQAAGLLSLLGITGSGDNPAELGSTVVPTFDMLNVYAVRNLQQLAVGSAVAPAASGSAVSITVPAGEYWLVRDVSGSMLASAAAQQLGHSIIYQVTSGVPSLCIDTCTNLASIAANDIGRCFSRQDRIFGPGAVFSCIVERTNAANVSFTIAVTFLRLTA